MLLVLLFGTMFIVGIIENFKGVSFPLIKLEFNASWEQHGLMVSVLSFSYVGFVILAGIFLGHFGVKPSYISGFAALTTGIIAVNLLPGYFSAITCLFIVFAGFGFFEVSMNALASGLFRKNTAILMNLLHAFYGIGAIIGPKAAGIMTNNAGLNWRFVYLVSLPFVLLLLIQSVFLKFPQVKKDDEHNPNVNFFYALKNPTVWLLAVILGLGVAIELSSPNWGSLYFQDVYGLDPRTSGAGFLSMFFICFTVSRLVCGILVEKIGYTRSLTGIMVFMFAIYIAGFLLGEKGIYLLPVLGFFIGPFWPTIMAIAVMRFGGNAAVYASAIIALGGSLNAFLQFVIGLTNRFFGPAWGYRSCVLYVLVCFSLLLVLNRKMKNANLKKP
jgi:fucose permease